MAKIEIKQAQEYFKDESKFVGHACEVYLIDTIEELQKVVTENDHVTIQGAKTGICGGATPTDDVLVVLNRLNQVCDFCSVDDGYLITVQAGMTLLQLTNMLESRQIPTTLFSDDACCSLNKFLKKDTHFWPINPTEKSASIGGIVSLNAKGIYAKYYQNNDYIQALSIMLYDGSLHKVERGQYLNEKGIIYFNGLNIICDTLDLIDLFIGSEGNYGIIVDVTLKLIKKPSHAWGLAFFFEDDQYYNFADYLQNLENLDQTKVVALEFADRLSLEYFNEMRLQNSRLAKIPEIENKFQALIYVELHSTNEEQIETLAYDLLLQAQELNVEEDATWALVGYDEIESFHALRHAIPEMVNIKVEFATNNAKSIHKLSTDIASDLSFSESLRKFKNCFEKYNFEYVIFGHICDSHFHANIICQNQDEFVLAKKVLLDYYKQYSENSNLFFEHGIGKIKKDLFLKFADKDLLNKQKNLKNIFDPNCRFNQGLVL